MAPQLQNRDARRLWLDLQGLAESPRRQLDRGGLLALIERLGYVQLDSINTVARAHHMILFARHQGHKPAQLTRLLERDRHLFENWTHDAAIIPAAFFPHWKCRFDRERARLMEKYRDWHGGAFESVLDSVRGHVETAGPTLARDLGPAEKRGAVGWWDWHPEKTALEFLWRTGELAVARREGFQKVYDLTHRVIPDPHRTAELSHGETIDWACREALQRLGFAIPGEIARYWDLVSVAEAKAWCCARLGREVIEVELPPANGGRPQSAFARADLFDRLQDAPEAPARLRVISPFDPVIRNRTRLLRLFGFDYRIEVFVPAPKRTYGYYVFPLLEGDRFIGRIDMKRHDDQSDLKVTGLWLEPGVKFGKQRRLALESELDRVRRFVGAERVTFTPDFVK